MTAMPQMRPLRRGLAALALVASTSIATPAAADEDADAAVRFAARFVAERGDLQLEEGELEEALRLFNVAEQLFHAPTLVLAIAQTETRMGRWTAARRHYLEVIEEALPPGAPGPFRAAQRTARRELDELEPKIPRVTAVVRGYVGAVEVRVDGRPVPMETITGGMYVDPGRHDVVLVADSEVRVVTVDVAEGARETMTIDLARPEGSAADREDVIDGWWPAAAYGVGLAGLAVGTTTGILALQEAASLRDRCITGTTGCDPAARTLEESANTLGVVSTVGFVVGALGVVGGTTLLVVNQSLAGGGDEEVAVRVGPGWVGAEVRF